MMFLLVNYFNFFSCLVSCFSVLTKNNFLFILLYFYLEFLYNKNKIRNEKREMEIVNDISSM